MNPFNLDSDCDAANASPGGTKSDSLGREPQVALSESRKAPAPQANRCRHCVAVFVPTVFAVLLMFPAFVSSPLLAQDDGEAVVEPAPTEPAPPKAIDIEVPPVEAPPAETSELDVKQDNSKYAALLASLTIFVLAVFVGFEVITKVPPTLHTPLMSGSNAISGITIVGALLATGFAANGFVAFVGMIALVLASINVVGGFLVTHRMLEMFKKKK